MLHRIAQLLEHRTDAFAAAESRDHGKPEELFFLFLSPFHMPMTDDRQRGGYSSSCRVFQEPRRLTQFYSQPNCISHGTQNYRQQSALNDFCMLSVTRVLLFIYKDTLELFS